MKTQQKLHHWTAFRNGGQEMCMISRWPRATMAARGLQQRTGWLHRTIVSSSPVHPLIQVTIHTCTLIVYSNIFKSFLLLSITDAFFFHPLAHVQYQILLGRKWRQFWAHPFQQPFCAPNLAQEKTKIALYFLAGTAYGKHRKRRPNKHILHASHNGTDQHFCTLKLALLKTL